MCRISQLSHRCEFACSNARKTQMSEWLRGRWKRAFFLPCRLFYYKPTNKIWETLFLPPWNVSILLSFRLFNFYHTVLKARKIRIHLSSFLQRLTEYIFTCDFWRPIAGKYWQLDEKLPVYLSFKGKYISLERVIGGRRNSLWGDIGPNRYGDDFSEASEWNGCSREICVLMVVGKNISIGFHLRFSRGQTSCARFILLSK